MNRIKKEDKLKLSIIEILNNSVNPVSTQEIASQLEKPWHSIQTRCLRLQIEGKINGFRVGRINLWQKKNE
jgi:repressor of nif and glnA expression